MADLSLEGYHDGGRYVLVARGELAGRDCEEFAAPAVTALGDRSVHDLVLDLAGITFIDSTGIGALLSLHQTATDVSARLILRHPSPPVTRILHLIGMDTLFLIDPAP